MKECAEDTGPEEGLKMMRVAQALLILLPPVLTSPVRNLAEDVVVPIALKPKGFTYFCLNPIIIL